MRQALIKRNKSSIRFAFVAITAISLLGCFDGDDEDAPSVNNPPTAVSINIATQTETAVTENFPASDPDGDALTFVIDTAPQNGSVTANADSSFTYQPFAELTGSDSFSFTVTDSAGQTASATVGIVIEALQIPFTQFARGVFAADVSSEPSSINGREFIQDGVNNSDYQDLIDNN